MSSYDAHYKIPREKVFDVQEANDPEDDIKPIPLLVQGQGTFIFKHSQCFYDRVGGSVLPIQPLRVAFCTSDFSIDEQTGQKIYREFFHLVIDSNRATTLLNVQGEVVGNDHCGVVRSDYAFYWISLDLLNPDSGEMYIRFGRGEARLDTEVFHYRVPVAKMYDLRQLSQVFVSQYVQPMRLLRDPVIGTVPLVVKNTDSLTMVDVAANSAMPKATLPTVGQRLYDIVAGENFVLDTPDFPHFSDAIKRSIETEDG